MHDSMNLGVNIDHGRQSATVLLCWLLLDWSLAIELNRLHLLLRLYRGLSSFLPVRDGTQPLAVRGEGEAARRR